MAGVRARRVGYPLAALVALLGVAMASPSAGPRARAQVAGAVPSLGHVFLIMGENTSFDQVTPDHAPYLTGTIKPRAAWMTNYHAFPKSSSLGQYIAIVSGQYTPCEANNGIPPKCHQNVDNLFDQLHRAGKTWIDWQQSMDNACDWVDHGSDWSKNVFSAHHNPAVYFDSIEGDKYDEAIMPDQPCVSGDLPMGTTAPNDTGAFDSAMSAGHVGNFNLIVPNDCADGHDPCATNDPVKQFDDFLAAEVPKIEASPAFGPNDVIAITWDEGADPPQDPGHVLLALIGHPITPGQYATQYNHYSLARTLEDAFGVSHLANAASANPITGVWK
jgi:phosphatidylinositol-3-phosphatase